MSKNYGIQQLGKYSEFLTGAANGRTMLGESLGLTGSEISLTTLPAEQFIPFVHAHEKNEEAYIIVCGEGVFYLDGEEITITEGDVLRVDPACERAIKAGGTDLTFFCIQAEKDSLKQATEEDGIMSESKATWME